MEIRSPKRWIYGWSGIFTPVVGSCLSHYIDVYLPCGVWVVWSVGGPWKPPLASTQSCPSSLGRLTQVHCPDSKSQLPGGLQAPSLTEISSNLTVDFVPGPWTAWNTTWWMTWNASWKVASQKWLKNTVCSLVTHCERDRFVWQRVWGRGSLFKKNKTAYSEFCRGGHSDLCNLPAWRGRSRSMPKCISQLPAPQHMHAKGVRWPCRKPVPEHIQ